jgi:hypothetical protein
VPYSRELLYRHAKISGEIYTTRLLQVASRHLSQSKLAHDIAEVVVKTPGNDRGSYFQKRLSDQSSLKAAVEIVEVLLHHVRTSAYGIDPSFI